MTRSGRSPPKKSRPGKNDRLVVRNLIEGNAVININKHMNLLGLHVEDRVSGFKGIVVSVTFDLYGCIQALVHPGTDSEGMVRESSWFDVLRLAVLSEVPVMSRPEFDWEPESISAGMKGPAAKPLHYKP